MFRVFGVRGGAEGELAECGVGAVGRDLINMKATFFVDAEHGAAMVGVDARYFRKLAEKLKIVKINHRHFWIRSEVAKLRKKRP